MNDANQQRMLFGELRHDLRTPINAIVGYSEMLLEDAVEQGQAELVAELRQVLTASTELLELVDTLLDPGEIERRDGGVAALETTLRATLRPPITAITGSVERLLTMGATSDQPNIVSDLHRIHGAAASFLVVVERDLAGEPRDESQAEGGSADELPTQARTAPEPQRGLVLVVDDSATNRDILTRRLQRAGHQSVAVENGRQALDTLRTQPFDLVLLDVMMPEMDGYQVLQQIKADPAAQDIPVIMISALDELDSVVRCITLGAADYLLKPFNPVLLNARIGACLEQKHLRDQEVAYLRNVGLVIAAAAAVEAGAFTPDSLEEVANRQDALGQLGRVFQRMAHEVATREQQLRQQVQELRIVIDESRKAQQVAEITETEYFQQLQEKAEKLRSKQSR